MTKNLFTKEEESILDEGFRLKNLENYAEALNIFSSLESKHPNSSILNGIIASCYFFLEDYKGAEIYFKKTVALNEKSELASIGLFHSLRDQEKFKKALTEMTRFLSENEPINYKITIEELYDNRENEPKYYVKLVNEWYKKYLKDNGI